MSQYQSKYCMPFLVVVDIGTTRLLCSTQGLAMLLAIPKDQIYLVVIRQISIFMAVSPPSLTNFSHSLAPIIANT